MSEPFNNLAEALLHEALKWPDRETPSEILVSQGRRATKADYAEGLDEGYAWTIPAEGHFQVKLSGYWRAPWAERQKPTQGRAAKP